MSTRVVDERTVELRIREANRAGWKDSFAAPRLTIEEILSDIRRASHPSLRGIADC
jgi:hypothetical protein